MKEINIAEIVEKRSDKYLMVNALAQRVRALQSGSKPYASAPSGDPIDIALEEFREGAIKVFRTKEAD